MYKCTLYDPRVNEIREAMWVHEYALELKLLRNALQEVTTFIKSDARTAKLVYDYIPTGTRNVDWPR
jgi:hypothetical protein